jgi:hypothetical protein
MGDQSDARPLSTQDNTTHKNAYTLPCLERDSNLRSQCSSGRREFVPQTAQPLGPVSTVVTYLKYYGNFLFNVAKVRNFEGICKHLTQQESVLVEIMHKNYQQLAQLFIYTCC